MGRITGLFTGALDSTKDRRRRRTEREAEKAATDASELAAKLDAKHPGGVMVKRYGTLMSYRKHAKTMAAAGWVPTGQSPAPYQSIDVTYQRRQSGPTPAAVDQGVRDDIASQIAKLADLHAAGSITDEEFAVMKSRVVWKGATPPTSTT